MGAGPEALLAAGLEKRLTERGHDITHTMLELPGDSFMPEVQAAFELDRRLSRAVSVTVARGAFPMILSGNCITSVGTVAGIGEPELGAIWFDAHGDFNTPETTMSGFLDGMSLGILTGRCWQTVARTIPGFAPLAENRVMLIGARHFDPAEETSLLGSGLGLVNTIVARDGLHDLPLLRRHARDIYLHIDLDVLDPSEGKANGYAVDHGLTVADMLRIVQSIAGTFRVRAAALTAYDPAHDRDGRAGEAAMSILKAVADAVALSRTVQVGQLEI